MACSIDGSDSIIPLLLQSKVSVLESWDRRLADQSSGIDRSSRIHRTIDLIPDPIAIRVRFPGETDRIESGPGCGEPSDRTWNLGVGKRRHFGGRFIMGSRPDRRSSEPGKRDQSYINSLLTARE